METDWPNPNHLCPRGPGVRDLACTLPPDLRCKDSTDQATVVSAKNITEAELSHMTTQMVPLLWAPLSLPEKWSHPSHLLSCHEVIEKSVRGLYKQHMDYMVSYAHILHITYNRYYTHLWFNFLAPFPLGSNISPKNTKLFGKKITHIHCSVNLALKWLLTAPGRLFLLIICLFLFLHQGSSLRLPP